MKVTLAYPYTTPGGRKYAADSTHELPEDEAVRLLNTGRARVADANAESSNASEESTDGEE